MTIHIKPENRGKFTAYKQRTGKTTAEALHSSNPHVRQMANFARNAAKWKHGNGGLILPIEKRTPVTKYIYEGNVMKTKYSKPPKHMLGAVIGAATTAMSIYNSIKATKQAKEAEQMARNQRNSMLQTEDSFILDKYPVNGNQMTGFYKNGGKMRVGKKLNKEVKVGTTVEMEHKPTLDFVKKELDRTGKLPSIKKFAKSIAVDHLKDFKKTNNDDTSYYKGLIEEKLSDEKKKYPSGGKLTPSNTTLEAVRAMAKGGKVMGYNSKGGSLLPISSNMDKVKGNTHEEDDIDNTKGVKLINNGKAVAEVEDEEVIKDDKKVYSDRLQLRKGVTYAQEADKLAKKMANAEKVLSDPTTNFRKKNVAAIKRNNLNKVAESLFNHQEMMKQKNGIKDNDDNVPKGADGLDLSKLVKGAMPYLDNVSNAVLTAFTPKPAFPMLARQRKLKTDFNINPQLQDVTDTVNQTVSGVERGTSSSNVARQNTTAIKLAGMKAKGELYSQKENVETGLQNQDILNRQQVEGQNLARIEGFNDSMQQRAYNIQGRTAANVANAVEDFNKGEQATAFGKYQDEQLRTIRETYSEGGTGLRVDLNNPSQIEYLKANPTFKDNAAKDYLQKNSDGTYKYPREAQRFLQIFKEYRK